ncbi:hypothetical protein TNCV_3473361 [Trichonephila clavipes]|nr:hypothetical protein TNCV_3473361 [Trichonephila clavipes]
MAVAANHKSRNSKRSVIANVKRIGSCKRLNGISESEGTIGIRDQLKIPRLVLDSTNDEIGDLIEIHTFFDASKLTYGAAVYMKVRKQNEGLVSHITSKMRVESLKAVTLHELELLGDLVAARLRVQGCKKSSSRERSAKCSTGQTPK